MFRLPSKCRNLIVYVEGLNVRVSWTIWIVCALLKLVNSGAAVALSPRRGDLISAMFQQVFLVDSFLSFDSSFRAHSGVH